MPIGFSNASDEFTAFGGSGFSRRGSVTDGSDMVGEFSNHGSDPWQGFTIDLVRPIDLGLQKTINLDFYAFDPNGHQITLKLEEGTNPDVQVTVSTLAASGWRNGLVFDFSNAVLSSDGVSAVNGSGTYSRLTIFIDGGSLISGTYLIDDIDDGSTPTNPNNLDVIYNDLVWSDEFNTPGKTAINSSNWFHQTQLPSGGSWFNGEVQHYTNRIENSFVEDGNLNIVAIKGSFTDQGETKQYTSARLNSKFAFTYGRVDVRAKLPFGDGTWPAIWTLGKNITETGAYWQTQGFGTTPWPACGEIDIMEHGLGDVNHTSSAIHTPSSFGNTVNVASQQLTDLANNYHVYSMNWSPNQITFLVDDVAYYTYNPSVKDNNTWPFDLDQYLLLNVAMGGISGAIDPNFTQSAMVIDYVRVYQNLGLSIEDKTLNKVKVYPNPVKDKVFIDTLLDIRYVKVFDTYGKLILQKETSIKSVAVSNLDTGIYIMQIITDKGSITRKVIKI
ncbi:glycosyl hydrolase family protein [Hyunsoonleella flava]|uniref:Glycosyl hydrolase family protein n=2 Tax=Hyunsoonleella flava TaxID=2527939 RepID=A0A4Q9FK78_9FLAO|nr:glycosyl hydrolase family protein [Hyunsoonleella flava]